MTVLPKLIPALFIILYCSCSNNSQEQDWNIQNNFIDANISLISKEKVNDKRAEILIIDSLVKNMQLNEEQKAYWYIYKSTVYSYYIAKPDSAKLYADSVFALIKEKDPNKYPNAFALAYNTKGDAFYANNEFNEAYTFYYKARQFKTNQVDYCAQKEYDYKVGMILYKQRKFQDAVTSFQQSLSEANLCDQSSLFANYYRKQELMNNIALSFYMNGNYDSAMHYYNNALQFITSHQKTDSSTFFYDEMAKGVIYGNQGDVFKKQGNLNEAEKYYQKSIQINFKKGGETVDAQFSYLKLAALYQENNKISELGKALEEIRASMNKTPNIQGEIKWNKLSWKYFESTKNPKKAYEHLTKHQQLLEDQEKINKKIYEVDINKQLALLEQQNQLHIAQHENEVAKTYLISAIVILLLIIVLSIILGRNWLNSRKHIAALKELNETVNTQNEQLEIAMAALQKTIAEKDSILKLVAHDLRTPVASIPSMVEIILTEDDEAQKLEYLEMIKSSCNSSLTLIAEIMATADISNKNIEKEPTLLNEFMNDCATILEIKAKEKNQHLILELAEEDSSVMMNPEKMKRVVFNLVTNAIKFSKKDTTITLSANILNNQAIIKVSDNGIGIPEKILPEIFNISKSGKRKGTEGEKSYGLGLNICKRIVEAHDGAIKVNSIEGRGSTFTVELPLT